MLINSGTSERDMYADCDRDDYDSEIELNSHFNSDANRNEFAKPIQVDNHVNSSVGEFPATRKF